MISDALTRILVPVARLAMARGLGVRDVLDPLKRAFLIVAREKTEDRPTDSRLSLLTGLQRRDVVRLRDMDQTPPAPSAPARLLSRWPADVETLPRTGDAPSFESVAREIRQDVHPRTLLDLLVQAGAVAEGPGETVRLLRRDYLPDGGSPEQMHYLVENLHDHGMAAVSNVTGGAAYFDRAAHFSGLTQEDLDRLLAFHREKEAALLRDIAARVSDMPGTGTCRVRVGGYAYWEDET